MILEPEVLTQIQRPTFELSEPDLTWKSQILGSDQVRSENEIWGSGHIRVEPFQIHVRSNLKFKVKTTRNLHLTRMKSGFYYFKRDSFLVL